MLNAGSSSPKIRLYDLADDATPSETPAPALWAVDADWSGKADKVTITLTSRGGSRNQRTTCGETQEILGRLLQALWQGKRAAVKQPGEIAVVGHRVVHGGAKYQESTRITSEVRDDLRQLIPFAPLHEPANLEGMEVVEHLLGQVPQVAVLDTAYHSHFAPGRAVITRSLRVV